MNTCAKCFYAKRTVLATFDPAFTCLHPKSRDAIGFPIICREARTATGFCGTEGHFFEPLTGSAKPAHVFRQ